MFHSICLTVNAVLLTKNSNVEAVIFPERRATPTIHGEPRPLPKPTMIQNLDVRSPSTEFSEKRPVEYNVFPAAEPATSESRTDADLVDNSTPVSKPVQIVEDPKSISTRASESIPTTFVSESNPGSQQQPLSQPASGSAILYPGDHTKLLSYKYPIYYKDLTHYICSDENSFYGVINQCDHFIECKVIILVFSSTMLITILLKILDMRRLFENYSYLNLLHIFRTMKRWNLSAPMVYTSTLMQIGKSTRVLTLQT